MKRPLVNKIFILSAVLITGCTNASKPTTNNATAKRPDSVKQTTRNIVANTNDDSVKLTKLVRDIYKWHETKHLEKDGFKPQKSNPTDTLFTGIDLIENEEAIKELRNTGFFADDFLNDYRNIAVRMDKELRDGSSLWPEGEMPTFDTDADVWCNCQDSPDKYWEKLTLADIKFNKSEVSFKWTWGDNFYYKAKAKKEDSAWKISYLEGFDMNAYDWGWWKKNKK
ncbi:MAG: hypothetical protein M3O71_30900 [Bacteroidota bacterium]|nr:hypothetical protein [Bacteroidota bacterium]